VGASFGLFCWGDTDNDGGITGADLTNARNFLLGKISTFPNVYPTNGDTADFDGDTGVTGIDTTVINNLILGRSDVNAKTPTTLTKATPAGNPTVPIGGTQKIYLQVKNVNAVAMGGVGVVFTITGNGELLGGRGSADGLTDPDGGTFPAGSRWDISGTRASGGYAILTVRVTGSGQITVNAKIPKNPAKGMPSSVSLGSAVIINP